MPNRRRHTASAVRHLTLFWALFEAALDPRSPGGVAIVAQEVASIKTHAEAGRLYARLADLNDERARTLDRERLRTIEVETRWILDRINALGVE